MEETGVIMWSLGLSHRSVVMILAVFGVNLSHMSGWRDVQQAGEHIRQKLKWKVARVAGVDGAWIAGQGIMVAVDMGDGELLAIAEIDEKEKGHLQAWLKILKQKHNIGAIVTDNLATYKEIADELELGHQVCQFHIKRVAMKLLVKYSALFCKLRKLQPGNYTAVPFENHTGVLDRVMLERIQNNAGAYSKQCYSIFM